MVVDAIIRQLHAHYIYSVALVYSFGQQFVYSLEYGKQGRPHTKPVVPTRILPSPKSNAIYRIMCHNARAGK